MANAYFEAETLDDAMRHAFHEILRRGDPVRPRKGPNLEITGVTLEISNPRARLSRTETRGKPFGCLGELCWYLAGANDVEFIAYYLSRYREFDEGGRIFGAYGPRLFDWRGGLSQLRNVTDILKSRPQSRQAVVQLFDAGDIADDHKDVPCTCTLQFLIRRDGLSLLTHMRSNDAYIGLPHDVFCFTMLQEIVARELNLDVGAYKHMVGSLHIYETDVERARQFLNEGWQSTDEAMPQMPSGDPWPGVRILLDAEQLIRAGDRYDDSMLDGVDPYWADLVRLLQLHRCRKNDDPAGVSAIRERISKAYSPFVDRLA
jgi:thymidylate synthase